MSDPHQNESFDEEQALRTLLAAYLAMHNVPCTKCGYNLRGVTSGACPECGEVIAITVGRVDQSTTPWIVAMSLYGIAIVVAGVSAFTATLDAALGRAAGASDHVVMAASLAAFATSILGFGLLIHHRERVWVSSVLTQCLIVLSVLAVPLAAFVVTAAGLALT